MFKCEGRAQGLCEKNDHCGPGVCKGIELCVSDSCFFGPLKSILTTSGFKRSKILLWLSNIPFQDHHTFSRKRRHKDTGHWLLENKKFWTWRNSSSSSMLWLRGDGRHRNSAFYLSY